MISNSREPARGYVGAAQYGQLRTLKLETQAIGCEMASRISAGSRAEESLVLTERTLSRQWRMRPCHWYGLSICG